MCVLAAALVSGCAARSTRSHLATATALGPYSGSVRAGDFVFVSGKIGADRQRFDVEVNEALDAVEAELRRHDLTLGDIVSVTVFLTDLDAFGAFNEQYARRMPQPYPARAVAQAARLPGNAHVEIQVVAHRQ